MADLFKKALKLLTGSDETSLKSFGLAWDEKAKRPLKGMTERELIQLESQVGGEIFGPIPATSRREFFNLDASTWIWHEEWIDVDTGKLKTATTRYEVHSNGILKVQDGARYKFIEGRELDNLVMAVQIYYERVMREIYKRNPHTGEKLPANESL